MIEGWTERKDWTSFQFPIEILSSWTMHVREATLKCCVFHTGSKAITWWGKKSSGLDQCPPKHPLQCVLENSLISAERVRHAKPSVWSHIQINVIKRLQGNQEKITLQDKEYGGKQDKKTGNPHEWPRDDYQDCPESNIPLRIAYTSLDKEASQVPICVLDQCATVSKGVRHYRTLHRCWISS